MITKDMVRDTVIFKIRTKEYRVKVKDIVFAERKKRTIWVHMSDAAVLELNYTSLTRILQEAQNDRLQLCNRSTIVNRDFISYVDPSSHYIELRNQKGTLDLGCYFREKVMSCLADLDNEFLLRIDNIRYVIRVEDFLYAKSSNRALHVHLRDGREFVVSQKPIEYILQQVKTERLFRCARGVLVNREYITEVDIKHRKIHLVNGEWLEIGSRYVKVFST